MKRENGKQGKDRKKETEWNLNLNYKLFFSLHFPAWLSVYVLKNCSLILRKLFLWILVLQATKREVEVCHANAMIERSKGVVFKILCNTLAPVVGLAAGGTSNSIQPFQLFRILISVLSENTFRIELREFCRTIRTVWHLCVCFKCF